MGSYTYALSFRIRHSKDDLSEIPARLGLKPRVTWNKGEPRVTPTGSAIGGLRKDSYCLFELKRKKKNDLPDGLKRAITILAPHKRYLRKLVSHGCSLEFFVGWFSNDLNWGDELGHTLLRDLADLQISLSLDVYGSDPHKALRKRVR